MNYRCRHCQTLLSDEVIDLGHQPPSNAYLLFDQLSKPEIYYPLKVYVCSSCWLVQLPNHASAEDLFTPDYAYFSSTSISWCLHAEEFVNQAISRLGLGPKSFVIEIASNDGYLLQHMRKNNIKCLGIEPTEATAQAAETKGIDTLKEFFSLDLARQLEKPDLIIANNVLAHVPDINDFMQGISQLLKMGGRVSIEFPHLLNLLDKKQFDTIYHEHYSYLSLSFVNRLAQSVGLLVEDVEILNTHGGSLRVWLSHHGIYPVQESVLTVLRKEVQYGLETIQAYNEFQKSADLIKNDLLEFMIQAKRDGKRLIGYGAAAKGNTLLNYAGIKSDLMESVADMAISKQGKFLPGSHIPIISPRELEELNPDLIFVLPWNLIEEIKKQMKSRHLFTAIPNLRQV